MNAFEHLVGRSLAIRACAGTYEDRREGNLEEARSAAAAACLAQFPRLGWPLLVNFGPQLHVFQRVDAVSYELVRPNVSTFGQYRVNELYAADKLRHALWRHDLVVRGPHISFLFDPALHEYYPRSLGSSVAAVRACENIDGEILTFDDDPRADLYVVASDCIRTYLAHCGVSTRYLDDVMKPFIKGQKTSFRRTARDGKIPTLERIAGPTGSFLYCGGREDVYVWSVKRGSDGAMSWGGDYPPSIILPLFFSMQKICDSDRGGYVKWWEKLLPRRADSSNGSFVFPAGGRGEAYQRSFHSLAFDVCTSDPRAAAEHFKGTPFAPYYSVDLIAQYAALCHSV